MGRAHTEAGPMSPTLRQLTGHCATCMPKPRSPDQDVNTVQTQGVLSVSLEHSWWGEWAKFYGVRRRSEGTIERSTESMTYGVQIFGHIEIEVWQKRADVRSQSQLIPLFESLEPRSPP